MLPVLRSYERLSPELVLLVQSHNPNNPDTVTSDYLVTGARGWDWLNQLYPAARILDYENFNDQGKPEFKTAADELVDYPTIIRVMYAVLDGVDTVLFVVTELGEDASKIVSNIEKLLEKKSVTDKRVLEITIPVDCENPDQYIRRLMDEFITLNNLSAEQVSLRLSTMSAHRDPVTGKPTGLSYIDELPWVPDYLLDANVKETSDQHLFTLNIQADCEDPVKYVRDAIESYQSTHGKLVGDISVKINTENRAIPQIVRDAIPEINIVDAYPKPGEPWSYARGCRPSMLVADDAPYTNEGTENVADLSKAPKADIVIKDGDVVHYDGVKEYTPLIRKWAEDRNIIGGGSTTLDQFIKGLTEAGELWTHIGKGQRELLKDDIGDVYVCLVNAAGNLDINLEDHVRALEAFQHHSGRAMYTNRGLKRYSLQVLYTLAAVAQSIDNILDSDNERDVEFFKTDFSDACADVVYVLETIALEQGWSLTDCVIAAYEDIRDRKGLMVDGTFVKEKDFTDAMVSAALADDRVKPETKDYLRQWVLQQLSDQSQEMEAHDLRAESVAKVDQPEPVSGVASAPAPTPAATEVKTPFWRVWNDAQGNKANVAPFAISGEVAHLLNDQKDDQIVVTLGIFGQPNHNGEVFVIDDNVLRARLDAMIGKQVGEINNPELQEGESLESWFKRVEALDPANTAGTLLGYAVTTLGTDVHGSIIEVVGLVEPSAFTKDRVATAGNAYFGIRGVVTQRMRYGTRVNHVEKLAGFDLSIENPRELK